MNILDRAIGYISPAAAMRRMAWREAIKHSPQIFEATYKGGVATRLSTAWGSQTALSVQSRSDRTNAASMRDRARRADRDNPIAHGLLNRDVDNTIGNGMTLQVRTDNEEFNREAEEKFAEQSDYLDIRQKRSFGELQRDWYRNMRRDGDVGIVLADRGGKSRLQTIPGELIKTPDGKYNTSIYDGVELDATSRAIAYHVIDQDELGKRTFTRIGADNFRFYSRDVFSTDVRGISIFASVFPLLDQLDGYIDAVATAARMAAVFGLIFRENNSAKTFSGLPTLTNSQGNAQKAITLENGSLKYIGTDDSVVQVQAQQPMQQTPDFVRTLMRIIGLSFDMPLELALMDVSQANLSSLRGAMNQFYRACQARQDAFRCVLLEPIFRWWISREVKAGGFKSKVPEKFWAHEWSPQGWQFTDPVTEVQARLLECDAGFNSPQNVCAEIGRDFNTIQQQRSQARQTYIREQLPIINSNLSRHPQLGVGAQGDPLGVEKADSPGSQDTNSQDNQNGQTQDNNSGTSAAE